LKMCPADTGALRYPYAMELKNLSGLRFYF